MQDTPCLLTTGSGEFVVIADRIFFHSSNTSAKIKERFFFTVVALTHLNVNDLKYVPYDMKRKKKTIGRIGFIAFHCILISFLQICTACMNIFFSYHSLTSSQMRYCFPLKAGNRNASPRWTTTVSISIVQGVLLTKAARQVQHTAVCLLFYMHLHLYSRNYKYRMRNASEKSKTKVISY